MPESKTFLQFPDNAVVIVTGGASGIGRALVETLASIGVTVSAWDLNADAITVVADETVGLPGRVLPLVVDVTNTDAVAAALEQTNRELGSAAFLVNNAGPSSFTEKFTFNEAVSISLGSVNLVTDAWLTTTGSTNGHLVNVSSVAGAITGAGATDWYSAAKAGVAGYTRHLALNRPNGIRCNAVAPGVIATPRTQDLRDSPLGQQIAERNPMGRFGLPTDIANAVIYLLSPAADYVNGVLLPVDGGSVVVL